jgi:ApbE superfamily uncharacterized protein (UPF0280 family)
MQSPSDRKPFLKRLVIKQTDIYLQTDFEPGFDLADQSIRYNRSAIETYIATNPTFLSSLDPVEVPDNIPKIIKRMAKASDIAGTGPMASVAGAIAEIAAEALCKAGGTYGIANNGGDIAIIGNKPNTIVGIYDGGEIEGKVKGKGLNKVAFKIRQSDLPIGICTSAGRVGHSLSFGDANAAIAVTKSATIADAVATKLGNLIQKDDPEGSLQNTLEFADQIREVDGCLIIIDKLVGRVGKLPELVELENFENFEFY